MEDQQHKTVPNNSKLSMLSKKIAIEREMASEHDDQSRAFVEKMVKAAEKYENEFNDIVADLQDSQLRDEVYRSIVNLKFIYEAQIQSRTVNENKDNDAKVTSSSAQQDDEQDLKADPNKRYSAEWQGFNTNIKIHSKFNGLLKLSKRLRSFTEMVIEASAPIPKLREALTEMDKIKPEEVTKLIDLTLIEQLLITNDDKHQLTDEERDTIVLVLFKASRIVAFEIIEEGKQEASGFDGFKQIYNLVKTWTTFVKIVACLAKMTTFAHLDQYSDYCAKFREALKYIQQHRNENENSSRFKEMINFLKQSQNDAHQQWSRPDSFKSELNLLMARLKHMELEQCTARELNHSQARSEIKNVFGIFKMALFGLLVGGNWTTVKVAVKLRDVVEGMKEQSSNHLNGPAIKANESVGSEPNEQPTNESSIFELFHLKQFEQLNEFEQTVREIEHELEVFDEQLTQTEAEIEQCNIVGDVKSVKAEVALENPIESKLLKANDPDYESQNQNTIPELTKVTETVAVENFMSNFQTFHRSNWNFVRH